MVRPRVLSLTMWLLCVALSAAVLCGGGCAHAPAVPGNHQDPEVWRPINPQYPLP